MKRIGNLLIATSFAAACLMSTGCFSYTKETTPVAPVAVEPAVPTQSSTTTTTTDPMGNVQKNTTTTYSNP